MSVPDLDKADRQINEDGGEGGRYGEGGKVGEEGRRKEEEREGEREGERKDLLQKKFNWAEAVADDNGIYVNHQ